MHSRGNKRLTGSLPSRSNERYYDAGKYSKRQVNAMYFCAGVLFIVLMFALKGSLPSDTVIVLNKPKFRSHAGAGTSMFKIRHCTQSQATEQGRLMAAAKVRGCSAQDDLWMKLVQLTMPDASVFIDIGSNKGYSAAEFFSLWKPELGFSPRTLYSQIQQTAKLRELRECGACGDCNGELEPLFDMQPRLCSGDAWKTSGADSGALKRAGQALCSARKENYKPIRVYSFDGNPRLVNGLTEVVAAFEDSGKLKPTDSLPTTPGASKMLASSWSLENRAFTETCSPGQELVFQLDGELGHIDGDNEDNPQRVKRRAKQGEATKVSVPCSTFDQLMKREGLSHVDFAKIDTEGHDLSVLDGAIDALKGNKVTVFRFEYNVFWPETRNNLPPLQSITDELGKYGYVCYLEGKNALIRLTYCWSDALGEKQWSNIFCFASNHPQGAALISIFDSRSLAFLG
mmetsp:Transcript_3988/g.5808  ORF Transcript_3988/g.5808 Transcript_3988/m.5808 type:complete len:457 (+) Transcript_3988:120-1490(+)